MSFISTLKNAFVSPDDYEDEEYSAIYDNGEDNDTVASREKRNREVKIAATTTLQIVLARPTDYSEVKSIGDDLNAQKTVLLNLETVKPEDAKRILDFLSGVAYANGADIKMMAQKTFAIMPRNVGFSGVDLMSELESNGYSF